MIAARWRAAWSAERLTPQLRRIISARSDTVRAPERWRSAAWLWPHFTQR